MKYHVDMFLAFIFHTLLIPLLQKCIIFIKFMKEV